MKKLFLMLPVLFLAASVARGAVSFPITVIERVVLTVTPVGADATVFSVADALTQTVTLTGAARRAGESIIIEHMLATATIGGTIGFDIMLFTRSFAGTALNAAWSPVAGDVNNSYAGKITVEGSDWVALGSASQAAHLISEDLRINMPPDSKNLYFQVVLRKGDASLTTNALVFRFDIAWIKP
ncbi:hypothetical protein LCGC14_0552530 [marine sediment metagenome]|uniref:Uncharacterized protein n=1 Tax=marine sediment metagenome TaxID=412755 RepID=A0A0F9RPJ0_9ZZZZ